MVDKPIDLDPATIVEPTSAVSPTPRSRVTEAPAPSLTAGARVDRYQVLERVGVGGMGEVYAAYDPRLDRRVALKLLQPELAHRYESRLEREGQALARLRHPNVVLVHDVGHADGRLFVAMEFIEGPTMSRWLERDLDWRTKAIALLQAGRGLQAAHEAGLVHRDFKPANVILEEARDRVVVVDFGLARVEAGEDGGAPKAGALQTQGALGTPAYMAPEQIEGDPATPASDQWAFSVALFEALHGVRPFQGRHMVELLESIRAHELPEPGTNGIPDEIDRLLFRGLELAAEKRHPNMGSYLDALELELRPRGASRKAGWLIAGALVATMAGAGYQLSKGAAPDANCRSAGDDWVATNWSSAQRDAVREAFASSPDASGAAPSDELRASRAALASKIEEQLGTFTGAWTKVYGDACKETLVDRTRTPATLERRLDCLEAQAFEFTEVRSRLAGAHDSVAWLERVDELVRGLPRPTLCLRTSQKEPEPEAAGPIRAEIAKARVQRRAAELSAARATVEGALAKARALDSPATLVEALIEHGYELDDAGEYEAAAAEFTEAVRRARGAELLRPEAHALLQLMRVTGDRLEHYDESGRWFSLAEARVKRLPPDDRLHALLHWYRGTVLRRMSKFSDAETELRAALEAFETRSADPIDTAGVLTDLGMVVDELGRYDDSGPLLERGLAMRREALGDSHPLVANAQANLAVYYGRKGKTREALSMVEGAIDSYTSSLGPMHPNVGTMYNNRGIELAGLGRFDDALDSYARSLAVRETAFGDSHPTIAETLSNRGYTLQMLGRLEEAEADLRRALGILEALKGPEAPDLNTALTNLGNVLVDAKRIDEALVIFERSLKILRKSLGEEHPSVGVNEHNLGDALMNAQRCEEALPHFERAISIFEKAFDPGHYNLSYPLSSMGRCQSVLGDDEAAAATLERANAIRDEKPGPPEARAMTRLSLARVLVELGGAERLTRAEALARSGLEDLRASEAPPSPAEAPPADEAPDPAQPPDTPDMPDTPDADAGAEPAAAEGDAPAKAPSPYEEERAWVEATFGAEAAAPPSP